MFFTNKYDATVCAVAIILDLIVVLAGYGITKKNSKAYYLALVFVAIGFIFSIAGIFMAAGIIKIDGSSCGWVEVICGLIISGIMLGVLCFNRKEILN